MKSTRAQAFLRISEESACWLPCLARFLDLDRNERSLQVWQQNLLHCMTAFWCGA